MFESFGDKLEIHDVACVPAVDAEVQLDQLLDECKPQGLRLKVS